MKRLSFLAALLGLFKISGQPPKQRRKFYITGGYREVGSDCDVSPIICYGTDRVDAIANSGITVWEESEWLEFERAFGKNFRKLCADIRNLKNKMAVHP